VAEGMDPLVTATFLCLFLPVEKKLPHLLAITNPANHESALRLIEEYKSSAGVPPHSSWLAKELAEGKTNKAPVGGHQPKDHQTSMVEGCMEKAATAKALAQGETQEAPDADHRPRDHQPPMVKGLTENATTVKSKDAHGDFLTWHKTDLPLNKKLRCCCSGNCRGLCPGRRAVCPNVAVVNLPGRRSDALCLPSRVLDTQTDTQTQTHRHRHTATQTQIHRHTDTQTHEHSHAGTQTHRRSHADTDTGMRKPRHLGRKSGIIKLEARSC
jgi:hypothetical protein